MAQSLEHHRDEAGLLTPAEARRYLEALVEAALSFLDEIDGDADRETSLGWTISGATGDTDDLELVNEDGGDIQDEHHDEGAFRNGFIYGGGSGMA